MESKIIDVSIKSLYEIIERYVFLRVENVWFSGLNTIEPVVCFEEPGSIKNHVGFVINMLSGEFIDMKEYYGKNNIDVMKQPIFVFDEGPYELEEVLDRTMRFCKEGKILYNGVWLESKCR